MKHLSISFCILLFHCFVFSQNQPDNIEIDYNELYKVILDEYGFDQVLVNGTLYNDRFVNRFGHQFLLEDRLYEGTVVYKGKAYIGLKLNYDIYSQELVIFVDHSNTALWFVPSIDFISSFSLDKLIFSKSDFQGEPKYYQVVFDSEKLKCLYYWSKELNGMGIDESTGSYKFTDSKRKIYLKIGGQFERYRNNKSFTELFPEEIRTQIKQYIKTNRIKVNKGSHEEIKQLLSYCNSLL